MKTRLIAAFLSAVMLLSFSTLPAFATDINPLDPGMLDDNNMVDPGDGTGNGTNYIPPATADLTFGSAQNDIIIEGANASYNGQAQNVANAYVIKGTQGERAFAMKNAAVPVTFATDVTAGLAVTSKSTITVADGVLLDAPSMTCVPAGGDKAVVYYPVTVKVPNMKAGQSAYVWINDGAGATRKAVNDASLRFWLEKGSYQFQIQPLTALRSSKAYTFTATVVNKAVVATAAEPEAPSSSGSSSSSSSSPAVPEAPLFVGEGTSTTPYLLQSAEDLKKLATKPDAKLNAYYKLTAPVSLGNDWPGITGFNGSFEGSGQTITMSGAKNPLFNTITGGVVGNFTVNANLNSLSNAGAVAGTNAGTLNSIRVNTAVSGSGTIGGMVGTNSGTINNCTVAATVVSSNGSAGGIAGASSGTISGSTVSGAVSGIDAGGIAGQQTGGTIQNSGSTGTVTGYSNAGGVTGQQTGGASITNSSATGAVTAANGNAGGVAGNVTGIVNNSFSAGRIQGAANAGGVAGTSSGAIQSCYATGTVTTGNRTIGNAGGIAGYNSNLVKNSYALGAVTGGNAGGLAGVNAGTVQTGYATGAIDAGSAGGGIVGWLNGGFVSNTVAINQSVYSAAGKGGRVIGAAQDSQARSAAAYSNNYAWAGMPLTGGNSDNGTGTRNGQQLSSAEIASASTYTRAGFSGNDWSISNGRLPGISAATAPGAPPVIPNVPPYTNTGGGGGGGGGGNHEPPYSETFWEDMRDKIKDADSGDKIKFSSAKLDNMPVSILKLLKGKNVTLEITHGRQKITINGKRMYDIPKNRIFYTFSDLADLYEKQPAASSKPASSKPASSAPVQPSTPLPPPAYVPPAGAVSSAPPASSSEESSSEDVSSEEESSSEEDREVMAEESSEPEPEPKPDVPKKSAVPLIVAGIVILLALLGGGAAFYFGYYRRRDDQ